MPWFARDRAIEMDDDLRRRVVEDPSRALAMPLEDVARVESAAAEREGKLSLSNGECAHAAAFYGLALRALALDRGRAPMDAGARRRKRIELRLRLGDALAGANEPGRACGAYAAALRQLGLIARRAKARENEENDVEDAPGRERRDGEDVEETYDDGGDEATFVKDKPRVAAAFLRKANESSSKASIKGLVDGEAMYRIGRACQMAGRYNRALLAYETGLILQPNGPRDSSATQVYLACGEMYLSLQMAEYALECFRKVMKRPMEASLGTGDVLCEIASCYRVLRLPEEESRCMKSACSDPSHKPIRTTNVIRVAWYRYERDKDAARALRELTEANVVKKTSEGLYTLGRVHADDGEFRRRGRVLRRGVQDGTHEPEDLARDWTSVFERIPGPHHSGQGVRARERTGDVHATAGGRVARRARVRVRVRGTDEILRRCRGDGDARERRHRPWRCVQRVRPSELGASRIRTSSRNRSRANSKDENYDLGRRRLATRLPKAQGAYERRNRERHSPTRVASSGATAGGEARDV